MLDAGLAASYDRYGISGAGRGWSEVDSRFDLSQEPHEPFRHGWIVELDPYDPDVHAPQADDARAAEARGRQRHDRRQRQGRRLHGRRRAVRLHLPVRLGRDLRHLRHEPGSTPQHALAPDRHVVRRPLPWRRRRGRPVRRIWRVDPAHQRHRIVRERHERRPGPHQHPAGGRHRLADEDGPTRGHRGQPRQRPGVLRAHQQSNRDTPAETDEANPLHQSQTRPALGPRWSRRPETATGTCSRWCRATTITPAGTSTGT